MRGKDFKKPELIEISYNREELEMIVEMLFRNLQYSDKKQIILNYLSKIEREINKIREYQKSIYPENFYSSMKNLLLEIKNIANETYRKTKKYDPVLPNKLKELILNGIKPLEDALKEKPISSELVFKTKRLYAQQSFVRRQPNLEEELMIHLNNIKKLSKEKGRTPPYCYISYAWPSEERKEEEYWVQPFLYVLYDHLAAAGIRVVMDIRDNNPGDSIFAFMRQYHEGNYIILIGTESLLDKHCSESAHAVQTELDIIINRFEQDQKQFGQSRIYPMLISGTIETAYPERYRGYVTIRDPRESHYLKMLKNLMDWIYKYNLKESPEKEERYFNLWKEYFDSVPGLPNDIRAVEEEISKNYHRPRRIKDLKQKSNQEDKFLDRSGNVLPGSVPVIDLKRELFSKFDKCSENCDSSISNEGSMKVGSNEKFIDDKFNEVPEFESETINVSGFNDCCGLFALALAVKIAMRERGVDKSDQINFLTTIDEEALKSTTAHTENIAKQLKEEMYWALLVNEAYKERRLHSFTDYCRVELEGGGLAEDMSSFSEANRAYREELKALWLSAREAIEKQFEEGEDEYREYLKTNLNPLLISKFKEKLSKLVISSLSEEKVKQFIDSYCEEEADLMGKLIQFNRLYRSVWYEFEVGTAEQRNRLDELYTKILTEKSIALLEKEQGERFITALLKLSFLQKTSFECNGKLEKICDKKEIMSTVIFLLVRSHIKKEWDVLYENYCNYIKENRTMLSADELGCLALRWKVQLRIQFNSGESYETHQEDNPTLIQVILCNPSQNHWQVLRYKKCIEKNITDVSQKESCSEFSSLRHENRNERIKSFAIDIPTNDIDSTISEELENHHFSKPAMEKVKSLEEIDSVDKTNMRVNPSNSNEVMSLMIAAANGYEFIVTQLLEKKVNVNQVDENGWTPLMIAAKNGHECVVTQLLAHGADVNQRNKDGSTPLAIATNNSRFKIAALLLKAGAKIEEERKENIGLLYSHLQKWLGAGEYEACLLLSDYRLGQEPGVRIDEYVSACYAQGRFDKALAYLEILKSKNQQEDRAFISYRTGDIKMEQGEFKLAIKHYEEALQENKNQYWINYDKTQAELWETGNPKASLEALERFPTLDPFLIEKEAVYTYHVIGFIYHQCLQYEKALVCFNEALKRNEKDIFALAKRGFLFICQGEREKGFKDLDAALMINSYYGGALARKGYGLALEARFDEAEECFNRSLQINPTHFETLLFKGASLILQKRLKEARQCIEKTFLVSTSRSLLIAQHTLQSVKEIIGDYALEYSVNDKKELKKVLLLLSQLAIFSEQQEEKIGTYLMKAHWGEGWNTLTKEKELVDQLKCLTIKNPLETQKKIIQKELEQLVKKKEPVDDLRNLLNQCIEPTELGIEYNTRNAFERWFVSKENFLIKQLAEKIGEIDKFIKGHSSASYQSVRESLKVIRAIYDEYQKNLKDLVNNKELQGKEREKRLNELYAPRCQLSMALFRDRYLKKEVQDCLAPYEGEIEEKRGETGYGTHVVKQYGEVHFKYHDNANPCYPVIEYMIGTLYSLLAGMSYGTAPTEIVKLHYKGYERVLVASQTLKGINLFDFLTHYVEREPELIHQFDSHSFSTMIITSLLSNPVDGKADNYIVQFFKNENEDEKIKVLGFDNDLAFGEPVVKIHQGKRAGQHFVEVRNVFYFFPQMNFPIDPTLCKRLVEESPELLMLEFIRSLQKQDEYYKQLLKEGVLTLKEAEALQLPICFLREETLGIIYKRLRAIQRCLRENSQLSHMQLFYAIYPEMAKYYQEVASKNQAKPNAILENIAELYAASAPTLEGAKLISEQKSVVTMSRLAIKTMEKGEYIKPRYSLLKGIEKFVESIQFSEISIERQRRILKEIKSLSGIEQLTIRNCDGLDDKLLQALVEDLPTLKRLDLVGCSQFKAQSLAVVSPRGRVVKIQIMQEKSKKQESIPQFKQFLAQSDKSEKAVGKEEKILQTSFKSKNELFNSLINVANSTKNLKEIASLTLSKEKELVEAFKLYIPSRATLKQSDDRSYDLREEVEKFLNSKSEQTVLLLIGNSGSGKSFFGHYIRCYYIKAYESNESYFPLFVFLPKIDNPEEKLIEKALQQHGLAEEQIQFLKQSKQRLFLIIDGYDEIQCQQNLINCKNNDFHEWEVKTMITCRWEYLQVIFGEFSDAPYYTRFAPYSREHDRIEDDKLIKYFMMPFSSEDRKNYFIRYLDLYKSLDWSLEKYQQEIEKLKLEKLIENPFILSIMANILPALKEKHDKDNKSITRYVVYKLMLEQWFENYVARVSEQKKLHLFGGDPIEILWNFSQILAQKMMFEVGSSAVKSPKNYNIPRWACPLFEGSNESYRFIHASFLEFLVAKSSIELLQPYLVLFKEDERYQDVGTKKDFCRKVIDTSFNRYSLIDNQEVIQYFLDEIMIEKSWYDLLLEIVKRSNPDSNIAAANAISILNAARYSFLNQDLRGIHIQGANLEEAFLENVDLTGANLTGVNFRNAFLKKTIFRNAIMKDVKFGEWAYLKITEFAICLAFSPDERKLAIACWPDIVKVYELSLDHVVTHCKTVENAIFNCSITSLCFSPDSTTLAIGGDGKIGLWKINIEEAIQQIECKDCIQSMAFFSNEQLITGSNEGQIEIWNLENKKRDVLPLKHHEAVLCLAVSPNKQLLVSTSGNLLMKSNEHNDLWVWDLRNKTKIELVGHTSYVTSASFSIDGKQIATGSEDKTIRIWDLRARDCICILKEHSSISSVNFLNEKLLVSSDGSGLIRLWDFKDARCIREFQSHHNEILSTAFLQSQSLLVTSGEDKIVRFWELGIDLVLKTQLDHHLGKVLDLSFSPDSQLLVTSSEDTTVKLWHAATGQCINTFQEHSDRVNCVKFSNDGEWIAAGAENGLVHIWETKTGKCIKSIQCHRKAVVGLEFSPDRQALSVMTENNMIQLWNVLLGKCENTVQRDLISIWGPHFSLQGGWRFSDNFEEDISLTEAANAQNFKIIGKKLNTTGITFSSILKYLVTTEKNGLVLFWDWLFGECIYVLDVQIDSILSMSFSPDGLSFAIGGADATVRCWDVKSFSNNIDISQRWVSHRTLDAKQVDIVDAIELSAQNKELLLQRGAESKTYEDKGIYIIPIPLQYRLTSKKNIIKIYYEFLLYCIDSKHYDEAFLYCDKILTLFKKNNKMYIQHKEINIEEQVGKIISTYRDLKQYALYIIRCLGILESLFQVKKDFKTLKVIEKNAHYLFLRQYYPLAKLYFKTFIYHADNSMNQNDKEFFKTYYGLAECYQKLGDNTSAKNYYSMCEKIGCDSEEIMMLVYEKLGDIYYEEDNISEATVYFQRAFEALEKLDKKSNIEPLKRAHQVLQELEREMGLEDLEFDSNNTCILEIDNTYSVHITFEPKSNRLYFYSPLLDGLPNELDKREKLYEVLLTSSMLGGKMLGGGVGVAIKEELILLHCVLDMDNSSEYFTSDFIKYYVELVKYWREQCKRIVEELDIEAFPEYLLLENAELHTIYRQKDNVLKKLNQIRLKSNRDNDSKEMLYELPSIISFNKTVQQLKEFGSTLGLGDLKFDKNNTCILWVDNKFSLHFTYEPSSFKLYLYSPLMDGLPSNLEAKLKLYELLLQGSMLGGEVAGGGLGIDISTAIVLMHFCININYSNSLEGITISKVAPFFVQMVESWREKCAHFDVSLFEKVDKNLFKKNVSIKRLIFLSFFRKINLADTNIVDFKNKLIQRFLREAEKHFNLEQYEQEIEYFNYVLMLQHSSEFLSFDLIECNAFCKRILGRFNEAISDYKNILKIEPKKETSLIGITFCYLCKNDIKNASIFMKQLKNLNSNNSGASFVIACVLGKQKKHDEAMKYYAEALRVAKNDKKYMLNKGEYLLEQAYYSEAEKCFEEMLKLYQDDIDVLNNMIILLEIKGQYKKSLGYSDIALSNHLKSVLFSEKKARLLKLIGKYQEAEEWFNKAIALPQDENTRFAHYNKGLFLIYLGRYVEARFHFERAVGSLRSHDNYPYIYGCLALASSKKGEFIEAEKQIQVAIEVSSEEKHKLWALGVQIEILIDAEQYEEALQAINERFKLNERDYRSIELKAFVLALLGKDSESFSWLKKSVNHNSSYVLLAKGINYIKLRKYAKAHETFQKGLAVNPNDLDILAYQGDLYRLQDLNEKALNCFDKVLSFNPFHRKTLEFKEKLNLKSFNFSFLENKIMSISSEEIKLQRRVNFIFDANEILKLEYSEKLQKFISGWEKDWPEVLKRTLLLRVEKMNQFVNENPLDVNTYLYRAKLNLIIEDEGNVLNDIQYGGIINSASLDLNITRFKYYYLRFKDLGSQELSLEKLKTICSHMQETVRQIGNTISESQPDYFQTLQLLINKCSKKINTFEVENGNLSHSDLGLTDKNIATEIDVHEKSGDLIGAIIEENIEEIAEYLKQPCDLSVTDENGRSALWWAAAKGNITLVAVLIQEGANINQIDKDGWTPILVAAKYGHINIVNYLILNTAVSKADEHALLFFQPLFKRKKQIQDRRVLTDNEIYQLIKYYCESKSVKVFEGMNDILQDIPTFEINLEAALNEWKLSKNENLPNAWVIPLKIGTYRSIFYLDFKEKNLFAPNIRYFDAYGINLPEEVEQILKKNFYKTKEIVSIPFEVKHYDEQDSGCLTVAISRRLAEGKETDLSIIDINEERKEYMKILSADDTQKFSSNISMHDDAHYFLKAEGHRLRGEYLEANQCFDEILEKYNSSPSLLTMLLNSKAFCLEKLSKFQEALVCYKAAIKLNPSSVTTLINMLTLEVKLQPANEKSDELWCSLKRYFEELEGYERVLNNSIGNLTALQGKLNCLYNLDSLYSNQSIEEMILFFINDCLKNYNIKEDEAIYLNFLDVQSKLAQKPDGYLNSLRKKIFTLLDLSMYEKVLEECDYILRHFMNDKYVLNYKSIALIYTERFDEALQCLQILTSIEDTSFNKALYQCNKGMTYFCKNEFILALACYEKAYAIEKNNLHSYYGMGYNLLCMGKTQEAAHWFNLALETIDSGAAIGLEHLRQAKLFSLNGKFIIAIIESDVTLSNQLLEKITSELTEKQLQLQVEFYFLRGVVFSKLNKWNLAYESFQKLLSIKQNHFFEKLFQESLKHLQTEEITQIPPLSGGLFFYRRLLEKCPNEGHEIKCSASPSLALQSNEFSTQSEKAAGKEEEDFSKNKYG